MGIFDGESKLTDQSALARAGANAANAARKQISGNKEMPLSPGVTRLVPAPLVPYRPANSMVNPQAQTPPPATAAAQPMTASESLKNTIATTMTPPAKTSLWGTLASNMGNQAAGSASGAAAQAGQAVQQGAAQPQQQILAPQKDISQVTQSDTPAKSIIGNDYTLVGQTNLTAIADTPQARQAQREVVRNLLWIASGDPFQKGMSGVPNDPYGEIAYAKKMLSLADPRIVEAAKSDETAFANEFNTNQGFQEEFSLPSNVHSEIAAPPLSPTIENLYNTSADNYGQSRGMALQAAQNLLANNPYTPERDAAYEQNIRAMGERDISEAQRSLREQLAKSGQAMGGFQTRQAADIRSQRELQIEQMVLNRLDERDKAGAEYALAVSNQVQGLSSQDLNALLQSGSLSLQQWQTLTSLKENRDIADNQREAERVKFEAEMKTIDENLRMAKEAGNWEEVQYWTDMKYQVEKDHADRETALTTSLITGAANIIGAGLGAYAGSKGNAATSPNTGSSGTTGNTPINKDR